MSGKIFINYRRADAEAWADRLYERLSADFPQGHVFIDIEGNIPLGLPWANWLESQVAACDLMLVLIGRSWVAEFDSRSRAGERDSVRVEIEMGLKRKIPVVPVLLGDAPIPSPAVLPKSVRPILNLQAIRLQRTSFEADAKALIDGVVRSIELARRIPVESNLASLTTSGSALNLYTFGRVRIDAPFIQCAAPALLEPGCGWMHPGAGKSEWFKDIDVGPEMVVVPAGEFVMGSKDGANDEKPPHSVTIQAPFAVSRFAVTFDEWDAAGLEHKPEDGGWGRGRHPVVNVSWDDAKAYVAWLSHSTGKQYRLLSEAEWEYCCRAGTTTQYVFGAAVLREHAQFSERELGDAQHSVEVGTFPSNDWGLHELHGNVWEWCEDRWHEDYQSAPDDGSAWRGGRTPLRVLRGGSWSSYADFLRSAYRYAMASADRDLDVGFRVARDL